MHQPKYASRHVLGVTALSSADAQPAAFGWDGRPLPASPKRAPLTAPAARMGIVVPMLAAGPPASAVTTYFIWDGDNVLVETDGTDPVWVA